MRAAGWQPVIVTSAAIACGLEALGIAKRPSDMPSLQAAASVGQSVLSAAYANAFAAHGMTTSVVLLTRRDTADRTAYLHARDTLGRLLELGVVPVVNENDTVSVEQIRFGDNDTLAALVACLIDANLMVILSDIDGLYDANPRRDESARLIEVVERIDRDVMSVAGEAGSTVGSGGMITKIKGGPGAHGRGHSHGHLPRTPCERHRRRRCRQIGGDAVRGAREKAHEITPRKLWIASATPPRGAVVIDEGAHAALVNRGSSLLCVGVTCVEGRFDADDIIDIKDAEGVVVARGKVAFSSDEAELACGRSRGARAQPTARAARRARARASRRADRVRVTSGLRRGRVGSSVFVICRFVGRVAPASIEEEMFHER